MIGYWVFIYNGEHVSLGNFYQHFLIGFILLFDGNVLGRIPFRCKHIVWYYSYGFTYIIWTLVYAFSDSGTGDVLYSVLDWKGNPKVATFVTLFMIIVEIPLVFSFCWLLSLWTEACTFNGNRRILYEEDYEGLDGTIEFGIM